MLSSYRTQAAAAPPSTAASAIAATMALLLPRGRRVGSTGSVRSARAGLGERRGSGGRSGCRTGAGRRAGPRSSASCARAFSASSGSTSASSGLSGSTRRAYLARVDQGVPPSARLPVSRGARGRGRTQAATRTAVVTRPRHHEPPVLAGARNEKPLERMAAQRGRIRGLYLFPANAGSLTGRAGGQDADGRPGRMTFPEWWAKVMPPLWQYFSRLLRQTSPLLPPKGANHGPPKPFPLQEDRFQGTTTGGHDADRGPPWRAPLRGSPAVLVGEGHAPVVAVLLASAKPDESIAAPKGHGPPDPPAFLLQIGCFLGTTMGAMMAIADPSGPHRSAASPPWVGGEGHAPLWQYLSRLQNPWQADAGWWAKAMPPLQTGPFASLRDR
jgi:hypothetical protein